MILCTLWGDCLDSLSYSFTGELESIIKFCKSVDRIYLYGAGRIGKKYVEYLVGNGIRPAGFIVTECTSDMVDDYYVWQASEIKDSLLANEGIIATFKGAQESYIRSKLGGKPRIYVPKNELHTIFNLELNVFPFLKQVFRHRPVMKPIQEWSNILIIRIDVLGDSIMSTAFIREVRKSCPQSRISLIVRSSNELLFKDCPYISDLFLYECDDTEGQENLSSENLKSLWQKAEQFIKKETLVQYDVVFHLCSLLNGRGALEALMLGYATGSACQIGRIYAWKENIAKNDYLRSKFSATMSYISYDMMPKHETACMLDMLCGCGGIVKNKKLELWINDSEISYRLLADKFGINKQKEWIAVGIVGRRPSQCWPAYRYRQFFEVIGKTYDVGFIILGGNEARDTADYIKNGLNAMVIDLTGKTTLKQAMVVMKNCLFYVGANTGLMHMAAALEKPVLEISNYVRSEDGQENSPMGPWGTKSVVLQKYGIDGCRGACSKDYPHCITQISVQEVVEATRNMILSAINN